MASQVIKINEWTRSVKNCVEDDLRAELKLVILENPNWGWEQLNIQDVFGCAINKLPPVYHLKDEPVPFRLSKEEIREAIFEAMKRIEQFPLYRLEEEA